MFRKIAHLTLALLLLTTTMGFSVSKHYCGTRLVEISINSEAEPCCDDMGTSTCCHNETEYYQLDEDFVSSVSIENFQLANLIVLFPTVIIYFIDVPEIEIEVANYAESPPIPTIQTKLSLLQTYLC